MLLLDEIVPHVQSGLLCCFDQLAGCRVLVWVRGLQVGHPLDDGTQLHLSQLDELFFYESGKGFGEDVETVLDDPGAGLGRHPALEDDNFPIAAYIDENGFPVDI